MNKKQLKAELKKVKKHLEEAHKCIYIQGCEFNVENKIIWDKATVAVMDKVAEGLLTMTNIFAKQNISLDAMLKIDGAHNLHVSGSQFMNKNPESENTGIDYGIE